MNRIMRGRPLVRLVHWNEGEAAERAQRLRALGYAVGSSPPDGPAFLRGLRESPPAAVVIDLSRVPSHGRDVAVAIRAHKATRQIPIVFVDGEPEKVQRVRALLPDAAFAAWESIGSDLARAIAQPPRDPIASSSALAGYSGTPLPKKLGIKPDTVLSLLDAPRDFLGGLGALPAGVKVNRRLGSATTLAIWFVLSRGALEAGIAALASDIGTAKAWIAWPKKTSALASDLGQPEVRAAGLANGLVDFKVCAIDETWSGLLFTRRRTT